MNAPRTTITHVEPLAQRWIRVTFADGAVHEIDLAGVLEVGGVLASIRDDARLASTLLPPAVNTQACGAAFAGAARLRQTRQRQGGVGASTGSP